MSRLTQMLAGAACAPLLAYARWLRLWRGVPRRPSTTAREIEQRSCL